MNIEREQLKDQYKNYIDRLNEDVDPKNLKSFCADHCDVKSALKLLIYAKYLDFVKEDQDEKAKKDYASQVKLAIITALLSFTGTLALAFITFYIK